MGTTGCPETNYHCSLRNSPEEVGSHLHRGGSLKSRNQMENNRMLQEQFMIPFEVSTRTQGLYEIDNGTFTQNRPWSDPYGEVEDVSGAMRGTAVIY